MTSFQNCTCTSNGHKNFKMKSSILEGNHRRTKGFYVYFKFINHTIVGTHCNDDDRYVAGHSNPMIPPPCSCAVDKNCNLITRSHMLHSFVEKLNLNANTFVEESSTFMTLQAKEIYEKHVLVWQ